MFSNIKMISVRIERKTKIDVIRNLKKKKLRFKRNLLKYKKNLPLCL